MRNLLDHLTLIIPVHHRQYTLTRILNYYNDFSCRKMIVDSSVTPWDDSVKFRNIEYYHVPQKLYYNKMYDALSDVKTDFVIDVSDDDFTLKESILNSIEHLLSHSDCSMVFGEVLRFTNENVNYTDMYGKAQYARFLSDNYSSQNPLSRLSYYFDGFFAPNHSVIKTKIALSAFDVVLKNQWLYPVKFFDKILAFYLLLGGNFKALPVLFQLRDETRLVTSLNDYPQELEMSVDFHQIIERLKNYGDPLSFSLSNITGISIDEARDFLYRLFLGYENRLAELKTPAGFVFPSENKAISSEISAIMELVKRFK